MICILAIPITTLATVFRFLGTRRSGRKVDLEDWLALLALISFWLHAATALWSMCESEDIIKREQREASAQTRWLATYTANPSRCE